MCKQHVALCVRFPVPRGSKRFGHSTHWFPGVKRFPKSRSRWRGFRGHILQSAPSKFPTGVMWGENDITFYKIKESQNHSRDALQDILRLHGRNHQKSPEFWWNMQEREEALDRRELALEKRHWTGTVWRQPSNVFCSGSMLKTRCHRPKHSKTQVSSAAWPPYPTPPFNPTSQFLPWTRLNLHETSANPHGWFLAPCSHVQATG